MERGENVLVFGLAGARWNPPPEELRHIRRNLMEHEPRYIVQLLRLLMDTPNVANTESLIELCRSQTLLGKIAAVDLPLVQEIRTTPQGASGHHGLDPQ